MRLLATSGFGTLSSDLHDVVKHATNALTSIGDLPSDEEVDQGFLQWFAPKRDQMLELTDDLAGAYGDVGEGLLAMSHNLTTIDWGVVKDLEKLPDYTVGGPVKRADS
ncbi:hypothetical protein ACFQX6_52505 [Streptosporangium lutulentum]